MELYKISTTLETECKSKTQHEIIIVKTSIVSKSPGPGLKSAPKQNRDRNQKQGHTRVLIGKVGPSRI